MKTFLYIPLFLFFCTLSQAQTSKSYKRKSFDSKEVAPCYNSKDYSVRAACFFELGEKYKTLNQHALAIENFEQAKTYYSKSTPLDVPKCDLALSQSYESIGDLINAKRYLEFYIKSLEGTTNTKELIRSKEHLAEINIKLKEYDTAKQELKEVQILEVERSNEQGVVRSQAKIKSIDNKLESEKPQSSYSSSFSNSNEPESISIADEELKFDEDAAEEEELFETYEALDEYYQSEGNVNKEIEIKQKSLSLAKKKGFAKKEAKKGLDLAKTYIKTDQTEEALNRLIKTIALADSLKDWKTEAEALSETIKILEGKEDFKQALLFSQKLNIVNDSLFSAEKELIQQSTGVLNTQRQIQILQQQKTFDSETIALQAQELKLQKWVSIISSMGLILALIGTYFIYRNAQARRRNNQILALKSLRSQMNPHFIFNALNSVNSFIASNDERMANKFISEFSKLMRLVMEYSEHDFIPLKKEIDILGLYLKLEHFRFKDKFEYHFDIDDSIDAENFPIPPMLIQPYIENAVWHGLRYIDSDGILKVVVQQNDKKEVLITISDNGIGREKSQALKTKNQQKHNSKGMKNIDERINIINSVYKTELSISIENGKNNIGTVVNIKIPFQNKHEFYA